MSADARYAAHLRQRAKDVSPSNRQGACPLCKQRTRVGDSDSFSLHLSQTHGDAIEQYSKDPNWSFQIWKESLESRLRVSELVESLIDNKLLWELTKTSTPSRARELENPHSYAQQPSHPASRASPAEEFSHLSINKGESPASVNQSIRLPPDGDPGGGNRKRAGSQGDESQPQQSTKNPRRTGDQHGSHFKGHHFNESGQLVSRQLFNPVSEASTSQATFTSRAFSSTSGPQLTSSNQHHAGPPSDRAVQPLSYNSMTQSVRQ